MLGLTRSSVATIISSLTSKRYVIGRAYVVNRSSGIYCIGAMNVDRKYNLLNHMMLGTSNPASSNVSVGGVARNIAENLGRMELEVSLISMGGQDQDYQYLKKETEPYVNMQHVSQVSNNPTGSYSAVLDRNGEMQLAIADMEIYEELDVAWISEYHTILSEAQLIIVDLNLPYETVEHVLSLARQFKVEVFIIPVSGPKMSSLPRDLEGVTWLIVNQDESEVFFDVMVETEEDFEGLVDRWLELGVENVVITRGQKGSTYGNQEGVQETFLPVLADEVVDVTGAGDAYSAGIIYGHLKNMEPTEAIQIGMTNAYYTIQSAQTVRVDLTAAKLKEQTNELFKKGDQINEPISID